MQKVWNNTYEKDVKCFVHKLCIIYSIQYGHVVKSQGFNGGQLLNFRAFLESGKMGILVKSPPTGEKSMGNWENDMFYGKVHPQGKSQWETGKITCFTEKSTHRRKVYGKLGK